MAEFVSIMGMAHAPGVTGWIDACPPDDRAAIQQGYTELGRIMAEAVLGQAGRFDVMSSLPVPAFPGGAAFRAPLLTLAMTWFSLRDRLGI